MNFDAQYWQNRYLNNETGWDVKEITKPLKDYVDQINNKDLSILIPGAGNGYEYEYLIQNGFSNVTVIDIAEQPLINIKNRVENYIDENLICDDFFNHTKKYDLIIEQTFFCALNPSLRNKYAEKTNELLQPKGKIIGLLFQFPLTEDGPPFGGSESEYIKLFSDNFKIKTLETAYNSIKPREGRELFFIFEKK
ncbi:SAM-dependent methyltransferase [Flavobacterium sp.]|uniref:SAM-dependent methyltransferase n=1 Tax=Flavobacterium sp. TaxID=239 RepID=UPI0035AEE807